MSIMRDIGKAIIIAIGAWLVFLTIALAFGATISCGPKTEVAAGMLIRQECTMRIPIPWRGGR